MEHSSDPVYRNCYAFPALGHAGSREFGVFRLGGTGLANMLFPWARCLVQAQRYGLRRIAPTWFQICREQWAQNSSDKRTYHDLFHAAPDEITGVRRLKLLAAGKRVPESLLDAGRGRGIPEGSTVEFRGVEGFLIPMLPYREMVRAELLQMTHGRHKRAFEPGFSPDITIHVRRGDFGGGNPSAGNQRIELDWYAGIVRQLQARFGRLSTAVFSDGTDEELAPLLEMEGVKRATFGSSMADIFGLSRGKIFIASGSTFSMWASFLGQMPTAWFPNRLPHSILEDARSEILTLGELSGEFIAQCEASLARGSGGSAACAEADGIGAGEAAL